jgi:riboflavin kinase / FMN adenylyltransferase
VKRIRLDSAQEVKRAVVTVGSFDGLHIGHRAVVGHVCALADKNKGASVVVTFDPHPRSVIAPESAPKLLTTLEERSAVFEQMGIDLLAVVPFTQALRELTPEQFVDQYLIEYLGIQAIVVGYDHGFGKDRSGNIETMQAMATDRGFEVVSVPPTLLDGAPVSSTRVRGHVELGEMEGAARLLDAGYPVSGVVEAGDARGRTIGFPTANIALEDNKLLPPDGVYAGWVRQNGVSGLACVINLGTRPTFDGNDRHFEVHILDYDQDLYGKRLSIDLVTRLRAEQKFSGIDELKTQINEDIEEARCRLDATSISIDAHNRSTDGGREVGTDK